MCWHRRVIFGDCNHGYWGPQTAECPAAAASASPSRSPSPCAAATTACHSVCTQRWSHARDVVRVLGACPRCDAARARTDRLFADIRAVLGGLQCAVGSALAEGGSCEDGTAAAAAASRGSGRDDDSRGGNGGGDGDGDGNARSTISRSTISRSSDSRSRSRSSSGSSGSSSNRSGSEGDEQHHHHRHRHHRQLIFYTPLSSASPSPTGEPSCFTQRRTTAGSPLPTSPTAKDAKGTPNQKQPLPPPPQPREDQEPAEGGDWYPRNPRWQLRHYMPTSRHPPFKPRTLPGSRPREGASHTIPLLLGRRRLAPPAGRPP